MKHLLYSCFVLFLTSATANAQESESVRNWQLAHPSTQLISTERYNKLTEEDKALIGTDFILFTGKITLQQLEASEQSKSTASYKEQQTSDKDAEFIKEWLAAHQDLKIVPQSAYLQFTPEDQQLYLDLHSLILAGETITRSDIEHFN